LWRALPPDVIAQAESLRALFKVIRNEHAFSLLKDPALKQVFYLQLLITLGVNAFYEFYPLWLVEFARFDSVKIALVTAGMCLVMSVSSSVLPRLIGSERPLSQARLAALAIALGLIVQPWLGGWPGVIMIILLGVPISLYNAIAPAYFSEHFGGAGQGQIMGLLTTTFCLGNVIIALLGSVLTLFDTRLILVVGGLFYLAGVVMLGRWITGRGPLGTMALEA
jgi:MFS transporter, DHA1 family, tetracycline resistance protein